MKDSILKGAITGDKFLTRHGDIAVFKSYDGDDIVKLDVRDYGEIKVHSDGNAYSSNDIDIVGKVHEGVNYEYLTRLIREVRSGFDFE